MLVHKDKRTDADNPMALVKQIHDKGMKAGIAISPDTSSQAITDEVGNAVDMILVMTVYPGEHTFPFQV
jgi:ribulose-phosphate 3-epimerase